MKPFRQGDLDSTCGLYALVNSIRLAAEPFSHFSRADCWQLYHSLVNVCDHHFLGGFALVMSEGMGIRQIKTLLRHADFWLISNKQLTLTWSKPYTSRQKPDPQEYRCLLQDHLERGGSAILGIGWWEEHWTVLHKLTDKSIMLADSGELHRLSWASLPGFESEKTSPKQIDPTSTFLIEVGQKSPSGWNSP
jgi:hypothetical protein